MDQLQVKLILDKINTLFHSIQQDQQVSNLEKDLLLSYIRKLYEAALEKPTYSRSASDTTLKQVPEQSIAQEETKHYEKPRIIELTPELLEHIPIKVEVPRAAPVLEIVEDEPVVVPEAVAEQPVDVPTETPIEVAEPEPVFSAPVEALKIHDNEPTPTMGQVPEPAIEKTSMPKAPEHLPHSSPKVDALFNIVTGNDLSSRLAETLVPDLTKAFGLNEKILIINDLFGGQQNEYDQVIQKLNGFNNYATAQELLYRFANRFHWAAETKELRAKNFIKIVRRRYL